jgi:rare lipoprotein A
MSSIGGGIYFSDLVSRIGPTGFRVLVVGALAMLAACSQHSVVSDKSGSVAAGRESLTEAKKTSSSMIHRRLVLVARKHLPPKKRPTGVEGAPHGLASFYNEGVITANGEKFVPSEMTAAHRTLPFGTRLRVTDVATGQSVTVRINDRGPFIPGRVVDLSQSAAETLGIVDRGVAKVKLDVVE